MLYKALGAIAVISASTALGFNNADKYTCRVNDLECLLRCVEFVENETRFSADALSEILKKAGLTEKNVVCDIFCETSAVLKSNEGITFSDIWESAVEEAEGRLCTKDLDLFLYFSECVNKGDIEGQTKALKQYAERIRNVINDIKPQCEKTVRLSRSFGIYFGLLISVLLF